MEQKEGYVSLFENKINEKGIEGLRFAIDGKPQRDKAMLGMYLEAHGAALSDTVTKKTNYLVLTDITSTSKKRLAAEAYGIPCISESSFLYFAGILFPDLELIPVPSWLKMIAEGAFRGHRNLREVILPDTIIEIGSAAFMGCAALNKINIPKQLKLLNSSAFMGCTSLQDIELPEGMHKTIRFDTFRGCESLQTIHIPTEVNMIDISAFQGCANLRTIDLPHNLTFLGREAFRSCIRLREIAIPASLTRLLGRTFSGCRSLRDVYISDSMAKMYPDDFTGCPKLTIHAPAGSYAEEFAIKNGINVSNK